jgi:hypothetical protein
MPIPYEEKFSGLLQGIANANLNGVEAIIVHHPEVLGDNYAELVEASTASRRLS